MPRFHAFPIRPRGYAIGQRIRQVSRDALQVQRGSLYPALHRLEERGLVAAEWRETDRMARFDSLTRSGRKRLEAEKGNWSRLSMFAPGAPPAAALGIDSRRFRL